MKYKRIFTFGCSSTQHYWPTWADIIRYSVDIPVENWAISGIGNVGIFHRMLECDLKHSFNKEDLIIVQWSSWTREDRYFDKWRVAGTIFNNPFYDKRFIDKHWSWNNDIIKNCTAIISANKMFNIAYQISTVPFENATDNNSRLVVDKSEEIYQLYEKVLPIVDLFPQQDNKRFNNQCSDDHADIETHLNFYENVLRDKLGLPECLVKDKLMILSDEISQSVKKYMSADITMKTIEDIISKTEFNCNLHFGF